MGSNIESVAVPFCDICGQKEDHTHSIMKCWKCGKDTCPQHHHLVSIGSGARIVTYLCDPDRDEMVRRLEALFDEFREDYNKRKQE